MKQMIGFFAIVLTALAVSCSGDGQGPRDNRVTLIGSGNIVSQEQAIADFDRMEVGFAFDTAVRQGEEFSVTAFVDDNLVDYLYLVKEGRMLQIGLKPGFAYDIPSANMRVEVVMPSLVGVEMWGSSHVTLKGFESVDRFEAELSGSSVLEGDLKAQTAVFNLSGSSFAKLGGSGQKLMLDVCGNSLVDLRNFQVEDAEIAASCASTVVVDIKGRLTGEASQHARIYYRGNPDVDEFVMAEWGTVRPE